MMNFISDILTVISMIVWIIEKVLQTVPPRLLEVIKKSIWIKNNYKYIKVNNKTEENVHWFYKQYGNFDTIFSLFGLVLVCHIVNKICVCLF